MYSIFTRTEYEQNWLPIEYIATRFERLANMKLDASMYAHVSNYMKHSYKIRYSLAVMESNYTE